MYSIKFEIKYTKIGWKWRYKNFKFDILDNSSFSSFERAFLHSIKMTDSEKSAKFTNWTKMIIEIKEN